MTNLQKPMMFILVAAMAGCGGEPSEPDSGIDGGPCITTFDPAAQLWDETCPATYEDAVDLDVKCPVLVPAYMKYTECPADNLFQVTKTWHANGGPQGYRCYYDTTSHELVGTGMFTTDSSPFCGRSSSSQYAGRWTRCTGGQLLDMYQLCANSDGGADGGNDGP